MTMAADTTRLIAGESLDADDIFAAVSNWADSSGRPLYAHQEEALLHLVTGNNVILATPTGSGKTMVAIAALYAGLAIGRRAWYTAPIKALVSEKFFDMVEIFGADQVGMLTGDSAVNPDAPIICATAEVLAITALRGGQDADVGVAVLDEFHYFGDRQRGWAWQVPLLELPQAQFLLMSGTLGDTVPIAEDITHRTARPTEVIAGVERPVPLDFEYRLLDVPEATRRLVDADKAPIYLVHFTQRSAVEQAQGLVGLGLTDRAERDAIADVIADFRFAKGFGRTLSRLVRAGIGVHHAGMLPRYRRLVERLAQAGLLKVICGTDTLGVGINVPIRTVMLTALAKYDGHRARVLTGREFHQIAGRAGRAGFDTAGYVMALAPEHAVANAKAQAKAEAKAQKTGKKVKAKVGGGRAKPKDGEISWTEQTFERLVAAEPEPLTSHLRISHAVVLAMLARPADAVAGIRHLIESSHEPRRRQIQLIRRAIGIGRSLLAAGIVERRETPDEFGRRYVLTADLPPEFALDQPLSPLALVAMELLDPDTDDYALDVVSLFEATLPGPTPVLIAQRKRARDAAMWQMKADGLDYEERMNRLDEIDYPQPLADLIEYAYEKYSQGNPWVAEFAVEPKSVIREMFERSMTFSEYIAEYQLGRSEGVVLRYLAQGYRTLRRTLPPAARSETLEDIVAWLGEMVRGVDSSLLAEWEALAHPEEDAATGEVRPASAAATGITSNQRGFTVMVRNALFRRAELAAHRRYETLGDLDGENGFGAAAWQDALEEYFAEYDDIGIGPSARSPEFLLIHRESAMWQVRQIFDDPAGDRDWGIAAEIDLAASDETGEPELTIVSVGPLTADQP